MSPENSKKKPVVSQAVADVLAGRPLQPSPKKRRAVTINGLFKAFVFSFVTLFLLVKIAIMMVEGEVSTSAPRSKEIAEYLKNSLAKRKDVPLSLLLKNSAPNKTYAVLWLPYTYRPHIKCGLFPSGNLEPIKLRVPNTETIAMITSIDSNGFVDGAALKHPTIFCNKQPQNCIPLEKAYLQVTASPKGMCYTLSGQEETVR